MSEKENMDNLISKVALVTGGSRGIGKAIALDLAEAGCDVAVHFNADIGADLSSPTRAAELVNTTGNALGSLDVLVSNAGQPLEVDRPRP